MVNKKVFGYINKPINVHCIWSDGCASQYKSAGPLADCSLKSYKIMRNYFGSEHGKADGDGETGIINKALDRAITGENVIINDAKDAYEYCVQHFTLDDELSKRDFIYVREGEITRNRTYTRVKTVVGTRKIHQLHNTPGRPYIINTRALSCFCKGCNTNERCTNIDTVRGFQEKTLVRLTPEGHLQSDLNE